MDFSNLNGASMEHRKKKSTSCSAVAITIDGDVPITVDTALSLQPPSLSLSVSARPGVLREPLMLQAKKTHRALK